MIQTLKRNLFSEFSLKNIGTVEMTSETNQNRPHIVYGMNDNNASSDSSGSSSGSGAGGAGGCCGEGLVEYLLYMDYSHWHSGVINYETCMEKCGLCNFYFGGCLENSCYTNYIVLHTCPILCFIPGCH